MTLKVIVPPAAAPPPLVAPCLVVQCSMHDEGAIGLLLPEPDRNLPPGAPVVPRAPEFRVQWLTGSRVGVCDLRQSTAYLKPYSGSVTLTNT